MALLAEQTTTGREKYQVSNACLFASISSRFLIMIPLFSEREERALPTARIWYICSERSLTT